MLRSIFNKLVLEGSESKYIFNKLVLEGSKYGVRHWFALIFWSTTEFILGLCTDDMQ